MCLVPFPRSLCFGLSCAPVGVDEDMVRSLAKELVEDSLEMFVLAERARRAADSGLPGLPTSSSASRPLPGTGGGFSSTGTMYDSIAAYSLFFNHMKSHSFLFAPLFQTCIVTLPIFTKTFSKSYYYATRNAVLLLDTL